MNTAQLLKEKREKRAELKASVDTLMAKMEARTWNDATDKPEFDRLEKEIDAVSSEIETLEKQVDMTARAATWTASTTTDAPVNVNILKEGRRGDTRQKLASEFDFGAVLKRVGGRANRNATIDGAALEIHQEATKEMREANIGEGSDLNLPSWLVFGDLNRNRRGNMEQRDMTTTTTQGGYSIQTDIGPLIPLLDPRPIVRRVGATFLTGLVGNIDFPRNDAGASAAWEAEQGAADETSPTMDRVQLAPSRLAAFIDVSWQLLAQSTLNIQQFALGRLNQAVSNALDIAAFSGNGGGITGLNGESGVNAVSFLSSPTWAKLVAMESAISADNADQGSLGYLFHPSVIGALKTYERTSTNGRYLWEGMNNGVGSVNGYNAYGSTLVYSPATNVYHGYFGNWADMLIGQWGGVSITIDNITRAKEATTVLVTNSWWDVAVRHGESFCIGQSMHTS